MSESIGLAKKFIQGLFSFFSRKMLQGENLDELFGQPNIS